MVKRIWFDLEFNQYQATLDNGREIPFIDPISIGLVDEKDRTYSAVFNNFDLPKAKEKDFLVQQVLPKLPDQEEWKSPEDIRVDLLSFMAMQGGPVNFRYYFIPHDAFILYNIFGPNLFDTPKFFSGFPFDVAQHFNYLSKTDDRVNEKIKPVNNNEHDALSDARWLKSFELAIEDAVSGPVQLDLFSS